jgi:peptidoglycan/LPS O-acetylase OafA/YrhL
MGLHRLSGLDALRGIAATLVLFHHVLTLNFHPTVNAPYNMMVDFFFVLSGYVMARTFEDRMGNGLLGGFVMMRFRRLWGPMVAGSIIGAGTSVWLTGDPAYVALVAIPALLLMPLPGKYGPYPLNQSSWSIYYELVANAAHVFILRLLPSWMLAALSCLCIAYLVHSGTGFWGNFQYGYARVFAEYPLGIVLWRAFGDFGRWPLWPGCASLVLLPAAMYALNAPQWTQPFAILTFPFVVLCGTGLRPNNRFVPIARAMGALSFPLYAVHYPIVRLIAELHGPIWLAIILSLAAAVAVSVVVERSFVARFRRAVPTD